MFEHFALARDLRTQAASGDLGELRATADELARLEETWGLPPGSEAYLAQVREAATRAAHAEDHAAASQAVADLARTCGDCHVANESSLGQRFQVAEPLVDDPTRRHVNYLAWVSRLLWDGLVGPSERMWRAGAEALAAVDGVPTPRASHVPQGELDRTSELLRSLALRAGDAEDPLARADLVADVWTVCAECHEAAVIN
jgi:cytochrome c553